MVAALRTAPVEPVRVAPLATAPELLTESVTYGVPVTVLATTPVVAAETVT